MERQTSYFCDPAWHHGLKNYKADFLIRPMPEDRDKFINGYAACERHAGEALMIMLDLMDTVTVRRVNREKRD